LEEQEEEELVLLFLLVFVLKQTGVPTTGVPDLVVVASLAAAAAAFARLEPIGLTRRDPITDPAAMLTLEGLTGVTTTSLGPILSITPNTHRLTSTVLVPPGG
jgi:hypothetical protein